MIFPRPIRILLAPVRLVLGIPLFVVVILLFCAGEDKLADKIENFVFEFGLR